VVTADSIEHTAAARKNERENVIDLPEIPAAAPVRRQATGHSSRSERFLRRVVAATNRPTEFNASIGLEDR
jgi:hypothetical protein